MRTARVLLITSAALGLYGGAATATAKTLQISLPGIAANGPIPMQYTCDGANRSPAVQWRGAPANARSLTLIVDDPDAPGGVFHHWGAFNLPTSGGLAEGAGNVVSSTFRQARSDRGVDGYSGPCPPHGSSAHHYRFKLFAVDVAALGIAPSARIVDIETAMAGHVLDSAMITATYRRP